MFSQVLQTARRSSLLSTSKRSLAKRSALRTNTIQLARSISSVKHGQAEHPSNQILSTELLKSAGESSELLQFNHSEPSTSKTSPKDTLDYSVLIPPFPIKEMDSYPRLLDIDVITIIQPLYQRDWFTERGPHSPLNNTDPLPYKSMSLCKAFLFNKYKDAIEFMGYVNEVIKTEKHHPDITLSGKTVFISTHTHDAQVDDEARPTITKRDLRLAVLLETIYRDEFSLKQRGRETAAYWRRRAILHRHNDLDTILKGYHRNSPEARRDATRKELQSSDKGTPAGGAL